MTVRAATVDDLQAIAEIYAHYVTESVATFELDAPDAEEWARRFDAIIAARLPFLVAERDGAVSGYAYCAPWKPRPAYRATVEDSVYVAPWAVGKGCGTELLAALLDVCLSLGVREVIAVIASAARSESIFDSGDSGSVGLHRKFGFRDAGRLESVGYKHGRWLDTLLLQWSAEVNPPDNA